MSVMDNQRQRADRLRELHQPGSPLVLINVWDVASAKAVASTGVAAIAESAVDVETSALLVYRAAWLKDQGAPLVTREAAMAKLYATDEAQVVIDAAVQIFGGLGVTAGHPVERLYREIRALRIYEGATEVQKLIIARELLKA